MPGIFFLSLGSLVRRGRTSGCCIRQGEDKPHSCSHGPQVITQRAVAGQGFWKSQDFHEFQNASLKNSRRAPQGPHKTWQDLSRIPETALSAAQQRQAICQSGSPKSATGDTRFIQISRPDLASPATQLSQTQYSPMGREHSGAWANHSGWFHFPTGEQVFE